MKHVSFPPVALRPGNSVVQPVENPASKMDPRWQCLDMLRETRLQFDLKDRDIAVLRGLLSLLPVAAWGGQMVIFASNRTLSARCDGMEERTLRRRLARLIELGMITRRQSPNGKRYQLRGADGAALLSYGFDLAPLYQLSLQLPTRLEACRIEAKERAALKVMIRDRLYHLALHSPLPCPALLETARLSLRRVISIPELQHIFGELDALLPAEIAFVETELSGGDSQNVRHIQSSIKEDLNLEEAEPVAPPARSNETKIIREKADNDLTVAQCVEAAKSSVEFSPTVPRNWADLCRLADDLAPAIGIDRHILSQAEIALGRNGSALAVLGLVESYGRIRKPGAYLAALVRQSRETGLDQIRMFRSLTKGLG